MKAKSIGCQKNRHGKDHIPQETAAEKKAKRRVAAEARQAARDKLTDSQQLAIIAGRRGESKKETARLMAATENTPDTAPKPKKQEKKQTRNRKNRKNRR
jgi:hypothetical protein